MRQLAYTKEYVAKLVIEVVSGLNVDATKPRRFTVRQHKNGISQQLKDDGTRKLCNLYDTRTKCPSRQGMISR